MRFSSHYVLEDVSVGIKLLEFEAEHGAEVGNPTDLWLRPVRHNDVVFRQGYLDLISQISAL
jgi:hypothetical protein